MSTCYRGGYTFFPLPTPIVPRCLYDILAQTTRLPRDWFTMAFSHTIQKSTLSLRPTKLPLSNASHELMRPKISHEMNTIGILSYHEWPTIHSYCSEHDFVLLLFCVPYILIDGKPLSGIEWKKPTHYNASVRWLQNSYNAIIAK